MFRKLLAAAAVAVLSLGGVTVAAGPASAATAVSACFKWNTGTAYANSPVHLMQWNGAKWVSIRNGKTNASGCGTFTSVPSASFTSIQAYKVYGDSNIGLAIYSSSINNYATKGTGGVNLGTKYVNLVQCTYGLYDYCAGM
jgi:hypothetical protein